MSAPKLHWMVPCRRAVVRQTLPYGELVRGWLDNLQAQVAVMRRWYQIDEPSWQAGRGQVSHWGEALEGVAAARDTTATLDAASPAFQVRLWKGPLRVLLEQQAQPAPLGKEIVNLDKIEFEHGGPVRMNLNDRGEMVNPDARFLMGDVVEFPLFKFLAACGLSDFGSAPTYTDKLSFNGKGSFLLGTSLADSGGSSPPASPAMHDNLVAMRFQLLLNGYLAAFYHDKPVFDLKSVRSWLKPFVVSESDGTTTVYARGMIYAGELSVQREKNHWGVADLNWCIDKNGNTPERLPTLDGISALSDDTVVTPGGTCSPTTLFLSNYMMRHFAEAYRYGGDSVHTTLTKEYTDPKRRPYIKDSYEVVEAKEIAALVPPVPEEDLRKSLATLIDGVKKVLALVDGEQSFMRLAVQQAGSQPDWQINVREKTRTAITKAVDQPEKLLETVNGPFKDKRAPAEEIAALGPLHETLAQGAQNFGSELETLTHSAEWKQFIKIGPGIDDKTVLAVAGITCPGGQCKLKHEMGKVESLRTALKNKLKNLEKRRDSKEPLGEKVRTGQPDLSSSPILSDVNSVSLDGHEWGVVRLYPHEKLLQSQPQPLAGFMAAYNPLSGNPFVEAQDKDGMDKGQFFLFEEGDFLFGWPGTNVMSCGAAPFKWKRIEKNKFTIQVDDVQKMVKFGDGNQARSKPLLAIEKVHGQTPGNPLDTNDPLAQAHLKEPKAFHPIFFYPLEGAPFKDAASRLSDSKLYWARAVPYPTMTEVMDAFQTKTVVINQVETARAAAQKEMDSIGKPEDVAKEVTDAKTAVADAQKAYNATSSTDKVAKQKAKQDLDAAKKRLKDAQTRQNVAGYKSFVASMGGTKAPAAADDTHCGCKPQ